MTKTRAGRVVTALVTLLGWASLRAPTPAFPVDDTYIHLVYARNLAMGHGLVYNLGEPSIGTSSPLWTLALVPILASGLPAFYLVEALNAAILVVLAWLVADLFEILLRTLEPTPLEARLARMAAVAAVAFNGNLMWLAHSGMETILYLVLGAATLRLFARDGARPATMITAGLFVLTRFPGFLFVALCIFWTWRRARTERNLFLRAGIPALLYLPFGLYSWTISGSIFPTTLKGKLLTTVTGGHDLEAEKAFLSWIWQYLSAFVPAIWLLALPALLGIATWAITRRRSWGGEAMAIVVGAAGWAAGELVLHTLLFRSWWHHLRYLAPIFPVAAVLIPLGLLTLFRALIGLNSWLAEQLTRRPHRKMHYLAARHIWAFVVLAAIVGGGLQQLPRWQTLYRQNVLHIAAVHLSAGRWLAAHAPPNARIATFDIGAIAFESRRTVIDLGGLLDPASHPALAAGDMSAYMLDRGATHWVDLQPVPPSTVDRTGLRARRGQLFDAQPLVDFSVPYYYDPVHSASLALTIYAVHPLSPTMSAAQ